MTDALLAELESGPDTDAVGDGSTVLTRRELARAARALAVALGRAGARPGERIGIAVTPDVGTVIALLGVRAAGATPCPFDPRLADTVVPRLGAGLVLSDSVIRGTPTISSKTLLANGAPALSDGVSPIDPSHGWCIASSGTMAAHPRIVALRSTSVMAMLDALDGIVGYAAGDRVLCTVPFHHVYGLSQIWFAIRAHATLLIPPAPLLPGDLRAWTTRATVLAAVPHTVRAMVRAGTRSSLRLVTLAGQPIAPEDRGAFVAALPGTEFRQFYGLTEAFRILWLPPEEFVAHPESTGRPTPGMRVWLEDGELVAEGPNVAAGYLDDDAATAERFPSPGRVRTGDLFARHGDRFQFLGRCDGVFKSLGEKVVPELVEAAAESHPAVERCLVAPHVLRGEPRPAAWVVLSDSATLTAGELLRHMRERLAAAMVPTRISFVESLSTTAAGKLVRRPPDAY